MIRIEHTNHTEIITTSIEWSCIYKKVLEGLKDGDMVVFNDRKKDSRMIVRIKTILENI